MLSLSALYKDVATFIFEVYTLAESHNLVVPLVIRLILEPLPTIPPLIFDLFSVDDKPQTIRENK